jgi:hypothetical protein
MLEKRPFSKQGCIALAFLLFTANAFSQTTTSTWDTLPWRNYADFKLQLLNKSFITTGVLYDRVFPVAQVDEHPGLPSSNNDTTGPDHFLQAYYEMYNSMYNVSGVLHPDSLNSLIQTGVAANQHPVGIFWYNYNVMDSNALQDHLVDTAANGQFRDITGRPRSPYFTNTSFLASPLLAEEQVINPGQHEFFLDARFFLHNKSGTVQQVRIDFGDGQAEWIVNNPFGTTTTTASPTQSVTTSSFAGSILKTITGTMKGRIIVVIIDILGQTIQYGNPFQIFVKKTKAYAPLTGCKGGQVWEITADPTALAQVNTQYGNPQIDYKGRKDRAYFYYAGNGTSCATTVRRPIVFIDGFDPKNDRGVQQIYEDYINKPVLRNGATVSFGDYMLSQGFDFIILDFKHGNDLIERNALTLVALLQRLNQTYGAGYLQDITLIGPSMGSLVAQYALAYMEKNNIQHRVKTYISFDGCHQGANVPIGLQSYVEYITKRGILKNIKSIREGLYNGLAARQMLAHHVSAKSAVPAPDALRTKFLQNLAAVGDYPALARKVAIINGANNGLINPDHGSGTELLRINVKRKGFKSVWGACGNNICKYFDWIARTMPVSGTGQVAAMWTLYPLFNVLFWVPPGSTNYLGTATWNNSSLDNAPGGRFGKIFGTEPGQIIESNFQFLLKEALYLITGSKRSTVNQHLNDFTMMPSYNSADLRFASKYLYMNWSDQYLCGKTPFDYVYAPSTNEDHVLVSPNGTVWFENEIRCAAADLPVFVSPVITQLTGTSPLCTSGTFQISTCKPVNAANIVWSALPAGLVNIAANGTQATVTKAGNGNVTLTAKVNFCSGSSVSATKTFYVGGPTTPSITILGMAPLPNTQMDVKVTANVPGPYNWYVDNVLKRTTNTDITTIDGGGCGSHVLKVVVQNSCGTNSASTTYSRMCSSVMVAPNPTSDAITVSSLESSSAVEAEDNSFTQIEVRDKLGNLKQTQKYMDGTRKATLNLSSLPADTYILRVLTKQGWEEYKVLVAK